MRNNTINRLSSTLPNIRDKHIRTSFQIPVPVFAILLFTFSLITVTSVNQNDEKENREEPWERGTKSTH